jgi:hypothetical protein
LLAKAKEAARTELERRHRARNGLLEFALYIKADYVVGPPHKRVSAALEAVERGDCKRLIITMPPSTGKSELVSRKLPPWYIGRNPIRSAISASYGSDLAVKLGRDVRNTMASREYLRLFPEVVLSQDSQAADEWHTQQGGGYTAVGVGGGLTGFHGDLLNIDDPFKDRVQAESENYRESVWNWYRAVFYTRRKDPRTTAIVICCTRWHEDDLVGRLLAAQADGSGDTFELLEIPALNSDGSSFYPEKFSVDELKNIRAVIGEYDWASLYEQHPRPLTGSFFDSVNLLEDGKPIPWPERCDIVFCTIDTAVKDGNQHDGLGCVYWAYNKANTKQPLTILDWDLTQIQGAVLIDWLPGVFKTMESMAKDCKARMGVAGAWIEDKAAGSVLLQQAASHPEWATRAPPSDLTSIGKSARSINISRHVREGKVKMSERAYNRVSTYKGRIKNHLLSQILNFRPGSKDQGEDDLLDCFDYGVAIALGGSGGF